VKYLRTAFDLAFVLANLILIIYRSRYYEVDRHLFSVGPGVGVHTFGRVNILDAVVLLNMGLFLLLSRKLFKISWISRLVGGKTFWNSWSPIGFLLLALSLISFLTR
jgi:hypothetical protein